MMKTPKITVINATPDMLDPLLDALPSRDFQELARLLQQAQHGDCDFLVAILGGHPVGYCLIYWNSEFPLFSAENTPEIVDLIVAKTHRQQGIASAILDDIEQRLTIQNHKKVGLSVHVTNKPAYNLYIKRGYAVAEEVDNTNLMLVKNLVT